MQSRLLFSWRALEKALGVPQKTDLGARVRLFVVCLYGNSPEDLMVIVPKHQIKIFVVLTASNLNI